MGEGSITLIGIVVIAGFILGIVWERRRRAMFVMSATALLVLFLTSGGDQGGSPSIADSSRREGQSSDVAEYVTQLNREIASIPSVQASKYSGDVASVNAGLMLIEAWANLYGQGKDLTLTEDARGRHARLKQLLERKQVEMFPVLREAYGVAMLKQLQGTDGIAGTRGVGNQIVEFKSSSFASTGDVERIHQEIRENLMLLRFTKAEYRRFVGARLFSYFLEVPKDSEIVTWKSGGSYSVLK